MELLENRTFDEIQLGDALSIERTLAEHEVQLLAAAAGLLGPVHVEQALRGPAALAGGLAPGLWLTGLLTTLFAGKLPGPGSTVLSQDLRFAGELHVGDKAWLVRERMQTLEERLDPAHFARVHRSAIVRLDRIDALLREAGGDYTLRLKSGRQFPVSRSRIESLERWMGLSGASPAARSP